MSTSSRVVIAEAAVASGLVIAATAVASPGDLWLHDVGMHPAWLAVIAMAARYASRGLFPTLILTWGGLTGVSAALGGSVRELTTRVSNPADLIALTAAVLVAWIAMMHESRIGRAQQKLGEASEAQQHAEESVEALHRSLGYLRRRHDRLDVSLGMWRSLAARLERGDAGEAGRAVLELCEIRAGARAGIVQIRDGNRLTKVAARGNWGPLMIRPLDIGGDATVRAAILSRSVTPAGPGSTEGDSDVAVPVLDEDGSMVIGVIALRGVSPAHLRAADLRDLGVLAQWIAPALGRALQARTSTRRTGEVKA
jgi:hypothetical protein